MEIYFNNDGTYDKSALKAPVLSSERIPIGFISEVTEDKVTCYIWDRYISKEIIGVSIDGIKDYASIGISTR